MDIEDSVKKDKKDTLEKMYQNYKDYLIMGGIDENDIPPKKELEEFLDEEVYGIKCSRGY